jgi:hypothetical protein
VSSYSEKFGTRAALQLLLSLDFEGHGALDWAADNGSVSVLEFLIRRGLDPFRVDQMHRGPLYWTVKSRRYAAAKFLLYCGCDPWYEDSSSQSPVDLAEQQGDKEMVDLLKTPVPAHIRTVLPPLNSNVNATNRFSNFAMDNPGPINPVNHQGSLNAFIAPIFAKSSNSSLHSPRLSRDRSGDSLSDTATVSDVEMAVIPTRQSESVVPSPPIKLSVLASSSSNYTNTSVSTTGSSNSSTRETITENSGSGVNYVIPNSSLTTTAAYALDGSAIVSYLEPENHWIGYILSTCRRCLCFSTIFRDASSTPSVLNAAASTTVSCRKSKAIFRQNGTRMNFMFCYAFLMIFYWFLMMCIPSYAFIIFMVVSLLLARSVDVNAAMLNKKALTTTNNGNSNVAVAATGMKSEDKSRSSLWMVSEDATHSAVIFIDRVW